MQQITIYFPDAGEDIIGALRVVRDTGILYNALRIERGMFAVSIAEYDLSKMLTLIPYSTTEDKKCTA